MNTHPVDDKQRKISSTDTLITQALKDIAALKWLAPISSLLPRRSAEFGRAIEASLNQLAETHRVMKLQLRKSDKAVVIGVDQYQAILDMKQHYEQLVEKVRELELAQAGNEYDRLFQRIASPESRQAADTLFELSDDTLNHQYKK